LPDAKDAPLIGALDSLYMSLKNLLWGFQRAMWILLISGNT